MNKKLILLFTALLIFFTGCGDELITTQNHNSTREQQIEKLPPKEPEKAKEINDLLKDMGIDLTQTKVAIDINKTDHFFKKLEIEMHGKVEEIERKIENAEINFTKGIGIEVNENRVGIDLNKTRKMLQEINIFMKEDSFRCQSYD